MNRSESITQLADALSKAQSQFTPVVRSSTGYNYKYADLSAVWNMVRDPLTSNGLSVTQIPSLIDSVTADESTGNIIARIDVQVETVLLHNSGEWISATIKMPLAKQDAQGVGSIITYGRRYGLTAILGVVADEDDDGVAGSQNKPSARQPATAPVKSGKPATAPKTENPVDKIVGKGAAGKKRNELSTLLTQLNQAGVLAPDNNKWTAERLDAYTQDAFDKPLNQIDDDEVTILMTDLSDQLAERQALADDSGEATDVATEPETPTHTGPAGTIKEGQLIALRNLSDIKDLDETEVVQKISNGEISKFGDLSEEQAAALIKEINQM